MIRRRASRAIIGLVLLGLAVAAFAVPSVLRGVAAFAGDTEAAGRFSGSWQAEWGLWAHMISGGAVSLLAVLQWAGPVRKRWPRAHRTSGRVLVPLAVLTAIGGLTYITLQGTIGGPLMSAGFALYGVLMALAAVMTARHAIVGAFAAHRQWGLRLVILALGSWIYRAHYGLWYGVTCMISDRLCGWGSQPDFRGGFDIVQNVAFYLPYLVLLEVVLRTETPPQLSGHRTKSSASAP